MRSMRDTRSFPSDSSICRIPASFPLVQTLVARKRFLCAFNSPARSPTTVSDRPYIGEESTTLPPSLMNSPSTWRKGPRSAAIGPTSKVCQVPSPITGSYSPVREIGLFIIVSAILVPLLKLTAPAAIIIPRKFLREILSVGPSCRLSIDTMSIRSELKIKTRVLNERLRRQRRRRNRLRPADGLHRQRDL